MRGGDPVVCRHAVQRMPPEPHSTAVSRRFVGQSLHHWDLDPLADDVQLALSELVTNALLHAGTALVVSLSCASGQVELAVFDGNPNPPRMRPHRHDLDADLDKLLAAERNASDRLANLDDRDPRLHVGSAGSVAGGRGLLLVEAVAAEWGYSPLSDGKAVWIRTPAPDDWPGTASCVCESSDSATTLASGRRVVHQE